MNGMLVAITLFLLADTALGQESYPTLTPQDFVDRAAIASVSEIETARIASSESADPYVQSFAHTMMTDQLKILSSLRIFAQSEHLHFHDDAQLKHEARTYIFQRNGASRTVAYAESRSRARKKAVALFRSAVMSNDPAVRRYAISTLPELMHHLCLAQTLLRNLECQCDWQTPTSRLTQSKLELPHSKK